MHGQEGRAVKLLESWDQNNLDVLDVDDIEVTNIKFGRTLVHKKLTLNGLVGVIVTWVGMLW